MNGKELSNMDAFLVELGLCRKAIAKDGSCIFRAVSEKLFLTQVYHGKVKETYLEHMSKHVDEYQSFVDEDLNNRLEALDKGKIQPGLIEMAILSRIYSLEFFVFHSPNQEPFNVTQNNFCQEVYLCFVGGSQYDLVYSKSVLQTTALCQSVLYEILYRDVFELDSELDEAVLFLELQKELPRNNNFRDGFLSDVISLFGVDKTDTLKKLCGRSSPPVPFRIAKALHPALFRNVELDIVQEEKREARLRNLGLSSGFSPGDKCQPKFLPNRQSVNFHRFACLASGALSVVDLKKHYDDLIMFRAISSKSTRGDYVAQGCARSTAIALNFCLLLSASRKSQVFITEPRSTWLKLKALSEYLRLPRHPISNITNRLRSLAVSMSR
ncbi:hypothetical protein RRG08_040125 [Elysia crispata]|uniref:OTU domain-containing protein n=1 Tax=Elysia crispata TaxID=231223 RepID=A0AAE1CNP6_9GAST|nr:hypothetical protein RRG08_040125 [Elysia crispata]